MEKATVGFIYKDGTIKEETFEGGTGLAVFNQIKNYMCSNKDIEKYEVIESSKILMENKIDKIFNEEEINAIRDSLHFEKYRLEESIKTETSLLDYDFEKILYYDGLIKVDWCKEAHEVYQKNKEQYLTNAHESYSLHMKSLMESMKKLKTINNTLKKIHLNDAY